MKQRLLLALLVLFASVGSMWGQTRQTTLTIPVNKGTVTVNVKLAAEQTMPEKIDGCTISGTTTIIIPNNAGSESISISLPDVFSELTVSSGTVTEVSLDDENLTKLTLNGIGLETLSVTSASNLAYLSCSNNKLTSLDLKVLTSLTSLDCSSNDLKSLKVGGVFTKLDCSKNHLKSIPEHQMAPNYKMTFGTQAIDLTESVSTIANVWKDVISLVKANISTPFPSDEEKTTYKFVSSDAHENPVSAGEYKFYNSSAFVSGDYVLRIQNTDTKYSGYTYEVTIRVKPAEFSYQFTNEDDNKGQMSVSIKQMDGTFKALTLSETSKLHEGDVLRFSVEPSTYYTFKGFTCDGLTPNSGFTTTSNPAEFTVKGGIKDDRVITATATYNTVTYKINQNPVDPAVAGSYTIHKTDADSTVVTNGASVAYGEKLVIKPVANPNYSVFKVLINGVELPFSNEEYAQDVKEEWNVTVQFEKEKSAELVVKVNEPTGVSVSYNGQEIEESGQITVNPSSKVELRFELGNTIQASHIIEDILINSKSYKEVTGASLKEIDLNTSVLTYTTPASGTVLIEPILKKLQKIECAIVTDQDLVYDNTVKKIAYITTPVQLSDVTLKYSNDDAKTFTAIPKNAGTYKVKYERAKDKTYQALIGTSSSEIEIKKAPVALSNVSGSINIASNGVQTYRISGSARAANTNATVPGKFVLTKNAAETDQATREDMSVPAAQQGQNHSISVTFIPTDNTNYANAVTSVDIKGDKNNDFTKYTIKAGQLPEGVTATIKNGDVVLQNGASVVVGTTLTLLFTTPEGVKVTKVYNDNASKEVLISSYGTNTTFDIKGNVIFKVETSGTAAATKDYKITAENTEETYDGSVKSYDSKKLTVMSYDDKTLGGERTITYAYSQNGTKIDSPVNAGEYDVTITVAKETIGTGTSAVIYKEATVKTKLIIKKATLVINEKEVQWPTGSDLGKGAALGSSVLSNGAVPGIAGTFEWKDPSYVPTSSDLEDDGTYNGVVVFKPASDNYEVFTFTTPVNIKIANKYTLTIITPTHGKLSVASGSKTLNNGDEVPNGTLTFMATPDQGYKLESIKVNGTAIPGTTYTANNISVKVEATFVEINEFTVSVSSTLKGIELVLPTSKVVKKGESFTFSVKGLAADLAKLEVSDGTKKYDGTDGTYTITNITANTTITVKMEAGATPTPIDLTKIAEVVNSHMGKPMGTIQVEVVSATRAASTTAYYGDQIKLTAVPASGCRFVKWIGAAVPASQATANPLIIELTSAAYEITAQFAGSPTGAEVIEGVDIYGSNGEIVVKCDGAARITIVSMNGQSKQQEISGDTRIPAGAGIYGIVFEQGNNVMRTKVAVK